MNKQLLVIITTAFLSINPTFALSGRDRQSIIYDKMYFDDASYSDSNTAPSGQAAADPNENVKLGQEMAAAKGWTGSEFDCLYELWKRESSWSERAINDAERNNDLNRNRRLDDNETISDTERDAYGIPQALPGGKMATSGSDWRTNPRTQITWGLGYIAGRYKTPCNAIKWHDSHNWY